MTKNDCNPVGVYKSFTEFYPFYLSQHENLNCRRLHFVGSLVILAILFSVVLTGYLVWLLALPLAGYGFAWLGHFAYEKNKPATFSYPLYSLAGDWVMFWDIVIGKISLRY
jgi:hypothetical protein